MTITAALRTRIVASLLDIVSVVLAISWRTSSVLPQYGFMLVTVTAACTLTLVIGHNTRQFNRTVAAETLVAFGVLSLVVGLGSAILLAVNRFQPTRVVAIEDLSAVTTVFIEGLFTAAVCPMLAMFIRIREAQLRIVEAGGPEMDAAARAAHALTKSSGMISHCWRIFRAKDGFVGRVELGEQRRTLANCTSSLPAQIRLACRIWMAGGTASDR